VTAPTTRWARGPGKEGKTERSPENCSPAAGTEGGGRILVVNAGELGGRVFTAAARAASSGGGAHEVQPGQRTRGGLPFYGDARGAAPARGGGGHGLPRPMGPGGRAGAGAGGPERVGPSGSARSSRIVFLFFEFIFNAKTIPEKPRNCLKARKILRKSQKFQENS
jgi:hypothetical protein